MNCPVCSQGMTEQDFGGVKVDVCVTGCKGIWFEWCELLKLDQKNEGLGQALQDALHYPRTNDQNRGRIKCPKCGLLMHVHQYQSAKEVNVDECYSCGGFFLDSGELRVIRDHYMTEEEEEVYCQKLISEIPAVDQAKRDLKKEKERNEAIRHYTRFLRLSYYVTKK